MSWLLVVGYLGLQLALGVWLSRRIRSEADFLVAGRRLGPVWVTFSMFATWFGAETCLGASGAVYAGGLAASRADPFGYGVCLLCTGVLLARRLWHSSEVTLGDVYRKRYGVTAERALVLLMVPSSLLWAAAQVRAFGQVVAFATDLPVGTAISVSAAFVVAYTFFGGLLGDVITDLVQGAVLVGGLLLLLGAAASELGGPSGMLAGIEPQRWSLAVPGESWLARMDGFLLPVLGSMVTQELIARMLAARSASVARRSSLYAGCVYLVIGCVPVLLGLVGPRLLPNLAEPEQFLPAAAALLLSPVAAALVAGALLSAILSTIDSVLLAIAALLSHNLIVPLLHQPTERKKLAWARGLVVASGATAYLIALHAEGIYALVEAASSVGTAGILVTTIAALYLRRGGQRAALLSLAVGLAAMPVFEHLLGWDAPFLAAIAAAAVAYAIPALWPVTSREEIPSVATEPR